MPVGFRSLLFPEGVFALIFRFLFTSSSRARRSLPTMDRLLGFSWSLRGGFVCCLATSQLGGCRRATWVALVEAMLGAW
jgi:hypothetical protein